MRTRKLLITGHERVTESGDARLRGLLQSGDPRGEVRNAWHAKEKLLGTRPGSRASLGADG